MGMETGRPAPRRQRSREAVRVAGATWRHTPRSTGDVCRDCGRCDHGADGHLGHDCTLSPAWFAGTATVCAGCFAMLVHDELRTFDVELVGIVERAARGDRAAAEEVRRVLDEESA